MEFQLSYFKPWKMMLLKCCTQYASKFGKLSSGHRTGNVSFPSDPKEKQCQRMFKIPHIALISHASKLMFKIFQARLQQYMNQDLPEVQAGFRKGRGIRNQIANICWIIEKAREFQKNIYFSFIDYAKAFDCVDHNELWKILKEVGISDYLTCLQRNLYADQEATVRTGHGKMDWFQIGKGIYRGCISSPCYLTNMQSTSCEMPGWMKHMLDSRLQGEISKTSYAEDTTLWQKVKRN